MYYLMILFKKEMVPKRKDNEERSPRIKGKKRKYKLTENGIASFWPRQ